MTIPKPCGELVHLLPMALTTVIEETLGVRRFQLIQTAPNFLRMRLDAASGASKDEVWLTTHQRLHAYLTAQRLPDVHIEQASEAPSPHPISGKFRHVWADRSELHTRTVN
ncbi:hypothetical protein KFU94_48270 [Chloroflexi bacterium TSY]|nr:hypothetical protein [Chloroflexi bacterium TSY]